jgi:cell division cycle 14
MEGVPKSSLEMAAGRLPARLFFFEAPENYQPPSTPNTLFLCTDQTLAYTSFFADFGPLDLGLTYKFCQQMDSLMIEAEKQSKTICYYCLKDEGGHSRTNSAVLLCAFLIFSRGLTAKQAYKPFIGIDPPLTPYRDAAFATNTWPLFVLDCCMAFHKAVINGHFDYSTFDVDKYVHMQQLHNGDMSWIVPGKLMAFSGPLAKRKELASGKYTCTPEDYIPLFKSNGVSCVVRFNNKCYDKQIFERGGIKHVDLFYEDGGNPTEEILQACLRLCETHQGGLAIHCKAGLGRTGTNICAYMIKHLNYSVRESVAWNRVCRPGSVVGPQQQFLCSIEDKLRSEGALYREKRAMGQAQKGSIKKSGINGTTSSGKMNAGKSNGVQQTLPRSINGSANSSRRNSNSSMNSAADKIATMSISSNNSKSRKAGGYR